MPPDKIAALEALEKLATKGEWYVAYGNVSDADEGFGIASKLAPEFGIVCECWPCTTTPEKRREMRANAALIVALRNAAPALIATIREQGEVIERLKEGIARMDAAPTLGKMCAVLDELKGSTNDKGA